MKYFYKEMNIPEIRIWQRSPIEWIIFAKNCEWLALIEDLELSELS